MRKRFYQICLALIIMTSCFLSSVSEVTAQGNNQAQEEEYHKQHGPEPELIADCDKFTAADIGVEYINEKYRTPLGRDPMECDYNLCLLAETRAKEVSLHLAHYTLSGDNILFNMMDDAGDTLADGGENIVFVNEYVDETLEFLGFKHEQTLSSNVKEAADWYTTSHEGHYENMTHPKNTKCGIGFYYDPAYQFLIVVHLFS